MHFSDALSSRRGPTARPDSGDPASAHANGRSAPAGARQKLLLVDDESDVLRSVQAILEGAGYAVTGVSNLAAALRALAADRFELVVTDLYLGDTELGHQVAEVAHEQHPPTPVVVMTGRPTFDAAQGALRHRVDDIVVKPVDPAHLVATCERVVRDTLLARRNQELESANRVLTSVLPRTIEMKDPTTSGHAARVVGYTDNLAKRCGINLEQRASLRLAALLHDIGKIGVPDQILRKPGPLTQDEMEVVKRHPAMGYEVLAPLKEHGEVRDWVFQHHERWDGKGYPQGLAGEDVALPGRILVLAEVYDALVEERSYKPAWPVDKIVALFRDQAGRQFDPDLAHLVANGLEGQGKRFFAASPGQLF